ncbi:putative phosphoesterase [Sporobacter termitidis DSM 10068]|uniref:Putative phosphoesterase n=1 Tax=Sporobacter termitidis DSM 10068 TaxID=1123282 RepID=A0A1M5XBD5_9FIRM|nr:metallophosphoesterase [Sporobacter termitidis]SHH96878.1 putative phosphoesterase [Sporobacter termitidis DSM 10068]
MKIGVISDIHVDRNKDFPVLERLAGKMAEKALDGLVIAGDISNNQRVTLDFIDRVTALSGRPVYFVPGNHDMWRDEKNPAGTAELYERYRAHPACLIGKSVPLAGGWVLLGDIGWYDYSFGNKGYTQEEFERKSMLNRTWQDSVFIDWKQPDPQVHRRMLDRLEQQLADTAGKQRIAVTHMVTDGSFTVPESRAPWPYFNAFLGSGEYGALFESSGVRYSIMGHVHYRKRLEKNGVAYICSCLNYHTEWRGGDFERELDEALTVISL